MCDKQDLPICTDLETILLIMVQLFKSTKVFLYIRYSFYYNCYLYFFRPACYRHMVKQTRNESVFLKKLIGKDCLVFDIGAHVGDKAEMYLEFARKVVSVEPDRSGIRILKLRHEGNPKFTLVSKAAGDKPGKNSFYTLGDNSCLNTLSKKWVDRLGDDSNPKFEQPLKLNNSYEVDVTTLDELIGEFRLPDYIKLDVEGFEENALKGLSPRVDYISLEANLPEFREESIRCIQLIDGLGENARFTYSFSEGLKGVLPEYINATQMKELIRDTEHEFMEILAKTVQFNLVLLQNWVVLF